MALVQQLALVQPSLLAYLTYCRMQGQNKGLAMAPTPTLLQPSAVEVVCLMFVVLALQKTWVVSGWLQDGPPDLLLRGMGM